MMYGIVIHGPNRYELQADHRRVAVVDDWNEARKLAAVDELLEACEEIQKCLKYFYVDGKVKPQFESITGILYVMGSTTADAIEATKGK